MILLGYIEMRLKLLAITILLLTLLSHGKTINSTNTTVGHSKKYKLKYNTTNILDIELHKEWTDRRTKRRCLSSVLFASGSGEMDTSNMVQTTLRECKKKCENAVDKTNHKCVAVEWRDFGTKPGPRATELRKCGLSYNCERLKKWEDGSAYVLQNYFDAYVQDEGYMTVNLIVVLQYIILFVACWCMYRIFHVVHRCWKNKNRHRTVPESISRSSNIVSTSSIELRENVPLVMKIVRKKKRKRIRKDIDKEAEEQDEGGEREDDDDDEGVQGGGNGKIVSKANCFICLEATDTCSTCVCHIPVHKECMQNIYNKNICSVCRTPFGSGSVAKNDGEEISESENNNQYVYE
jgi:hypothetical protein